MKKTLLLLALLILRTANVRAQDDPKSKAIIDKLIAKSRAYTSFEADFGNTLVNTTGKLNVKRR
ncbi:MAG: hypothetical protein IPO87_15740 [Flavobacteriales bacterium]|nr:hypothetical protein [Flavobacteriales bacterium]